jgi:hypothetical protein
MKFKYSRSSHELVSFTLVKTIIIEHLHKIAYCRIYSVYCNNNHGLSSFMTGFVTWATRRVPLVEQEMFTLPVHPSSFPVFGRIRVAQSLVFCVVFCKSLFVLSSIVLSVLLRNTALPLWYLQNFLKFQTSRIWNQKINWYRSESSYHNAASYQYHSIYIPCF